MKAVMLSIQPKWVELIVSGKKTVEVRKTKPKIDVPFRCYIYCTKGDALAVPCLNDPKYTIHRMNNGTIKGRKMTEKEREQGDYSYANGKVIGYFICYEIDNFTKAFFDELVERDTEEIAEFLRLTCLTYSELCSYVRLNDFFGWQITDLVIYDKPKELSEFRRYVKDRCTFNEDGVCLGRNQNHVIMCEHLDCCQKEIKRPFQSWGYVEELKGETE